MRALVTGGGGFVGGAIVRMLIARGDEVVTFQRGDYPKLLEQGAEVVKGDLTDKDAIVKAAGGCDIVFHVAAKPGVWGKFQSYWQPNVLGTKHVVDACKEQGVTRLVFTSSSSVVFDGHDESGIDESTPYPSSYLTAYPATKAEAERAVLSANGKDNMATAALRPHLVWGPGDPNLVPRIIERAKQGRLKLVGSGQNLVDSTYIDNVAKAHLLAGDRLLADGADASCAGKAYFISNDEPIAMADLINRILACADLPPVTKHVSPRIAYAVGCLLEFGFGLMRHTAEPMMTRFVARQLSTAHWFNLAAAKRDLGYQPTVSIDEGMRRLKASLQASAAD